MTETQEPASPDPIGLAAAQAAQDANPGDPVILFGSRARGDHHPDSDIDILIVCRGSEMTANSRARKAINRYFNQNPPRIGFDIVTMNQERFDYCRRAPNHVAAQALRDGIVMSGERLDHQYYDDDEYPASWPDVKERLQTAHRNLRGFAATFEHTRDDQETWMAHGQQAVENSIKAWASAAGIGYRNTHNLDDTIQRLVNDPNESETPAAHHFILLKYYTTYESTDPETLHQITDWLVLYAGKYKYSRATYRLDEYEQEEFRNEILQAASLFIARAHELTGTSYEDLL